ncbi:MAG: sigma-70 family RNA polymerase sigma factor [Dehalococcoidia bacterium]|nr:sigma-70 family RNA polymerase sigma factor [Dehalococcoidia bacterium]
MVMDEEELIQHSKNGDLDCFNELVKRYQRQVYNVAFRMLGDSQSADDAAQDTFISAWRAMHKFHKGNFRAWLLRIASNACRDRLRSRKRRATVSLDAMVTEPNLPPATSKALEDPDDYVRRMEISEEISKGLALLSKEQRMAIILGDIQGLSYEEISQVEKCSLGTVKSRISRGRRNLRNYLRQQGTLPT